MPELPEVETVVRALRGVMEGARIARVEVRRDGLRFPFPQRFGPRLEGREIVRMTRRAKYILATLDDDATLLVHLGMTGRFIVEAGEGFGAPGRHHNEEGTAFPHEHIVFHLAGSAARPNARPNARPDASPGARIGYIDPRRFGIMDLVAPGGLAGHRLLAALGVEALGPDLTRAYLQGAFAGKRAPLKAALLDQRIIAGLGNIYVCEALHRAGLAPGRAAGTLAGAGAAKALDRLIGAIVRTLNDAIAAGGSTLRDFAGPNGNSGYFQHDFRVYGRGGQPCPNLACGDMIHRMAQSGRSTYFCPACQK
ncbi:Formamidopyrimidine-DNA glycosylase [hydrothermal vent metagenome]|uniref:Formamidopyrimidine-DNA glycosylase n=1 Tax=hydrothermal vent metagenome TaxID=652676 RepID=A0A3B0T2C9_9ZZZZ